MCNKEIFFTPSKHWNIFKMFSNFFERRKSCSKIESWMPFLGLYFNLSSIEEKPLNEKWTIKSKIVYVRRWIYSRFVHTFFEIRMKSIISEKNNGIGNKRHIPNNIQHGTAPCHNHITSIESVTIKGQWKCKLTVIENKCD